ncbi:glycoside hydrolase family 32 protein [Oceanobacillus halophilus]|uniref:Sucrose-6-phosphate hydrolase n=1 Tax=Oceanobacillus halophilus TaxID=930130 RepID=A0A494ZV51_9BACI|nr:sucrose-6-phosphate hydrolase [Oceanobacillus halophilus]RKQ30269.1 sucrose-6-phosphate hydrolase [Oceanobacillus halophilus]
MTKFVKQEMAYERVETHREVVARDPYRLHYHIMPPVGLLNDPNGLVFFKGKYHVFYQWNPFETDHGAKFWGHYVSDDLVHWEEAPIALAPDMWYDKNGCYSGSAVVLDEKLYVFYTGNVKDEEGNRESYQCLAISEDGVHFEKKGPVIHVPAGYTAHFRDPKVFYHGEKWYMIVGAQTESEQGEAVLFTSSDLMDWQFEGPIAGSYHHHLEDFGYMWECPDLLEVNGKDVLIVCPQGLEADGLRYQNIYQSGYFAGKMDYETLSLEHGEFDELDRGFDFYAPQTMEDGKGRKILFGWMGNSEEDGVQPTVKHEWIHALTIPRELEWKNGKLLQHPVKELELLREDEVRHTNVVLDGSEVELPGVDGSVFELEVVTKDWRAKRFSITMGETSRISYDAVAKVLTFERGAFDGKGFVEKRQCVVETLHSLRMFKDTSSMEIFVNNGEEVFTSRVFDDPEAKGITFTATEGKLEMDVKKWSQKRVFAY